MKTRIILGIVIPTFNRLKYLSALLEELHSQIHPITNELDVTITVVNDGSSDGTHEFLNLQPTYVHEVEGTGSLWFTRCVNKGIFSIIDNLPPDYILILNDDVIISNDYLKLVAEYLAGNPIASTSIIGPLTVTCEKPGRVIFSGIKYINVFGKRQKYFPYFKEYSAENIRGIQTSKVLPGRGMLFPISIFVTLNGLDNSLHQYHSDEDFCLRALKKGYGVYINWDWILFSHHTMTSEVTSFGKVPIKKVLKSFVNKYSRNYLPDRALMTWRHQPKFLFPFLVFFNYFLILRSFLITRK